MACSIITLTTDFGLTDHYVGTMKGVMLGICPDAQITDITHEVPAFSVLSGAYAIDQAAPYFPASAVHLVVVDPGVGTARQAVVAQIGEQTFVAPNNGVLSLVLSHAAKDTKAFLIENPPIDLPSQSRTFHGRDLFAPVAAGIAAGKFAPSQVGRPIASLCVLPAIRPCQQNENHWKGMVLSVDRFGNVVSNFSRSEFGEKLERGFRIDARHHRICHARGTFGEAEPGLCFAYAGSSGFIEIGVNQASAAAKLGLHSGDSLILTSPV